MGRSGYLLGSSFSMQATGQKGMQTSQPVQLGSRITARRFGRRRFVVYFSGTSGMPSSTPRILCELSTLIDGGGCKGRAGRPAWHAPCDTRRGGPPMPYTDTEEPLDRLAQATLTARPVSKAPPAPPRLASHELLTALQRAGTRHIYADTADVDELAGVARIQSSVLREEIDGNTANQPLVRKAIERGLDEAALRRWDHALQAAAPGLSWAQRAPWLYALLCARLGTEIVDAFGVGRPWEISLQLHMDLLGDPRSAVRVGQCLAALVPGVLVKVPFAPDAPQCFLVARELELNGFPVNFTSTFSARQVVAAALLADVTRTNIFLGRLDQGLQAQGLGEHVVLEAQRALLELRRRDTVKARLIAASVREWRTIPALAGCDIFTIPCKVLAEL